MSPDNEIDMLPPYLTYSPAGVPYALPVAPVPVVAPVAPVEQVVPVV